MALRSRWSSVRAEIGVRSIARGLEDQHRMTGLVQPKPRSSIWISAIHKSEEKATGSCDANPRICCSKLVKGKPSREPVAWVHKADSRGRDLERWMLSTVDGKAACLRLLRPTRLGEYIDPAVTGDFALLGLLS